MRASGFPFGTTGREDGGSMEGHVRELAEEPLRLPVFRYSHGVAIRRRLLATTACHVYYVRPRWCDWARDHPARGNLLIRGEHSLDPSL